MKFFSSMRSVVAFSVVGIFANALQASLALSYQFNGNGNWSIDAYGLGNKDAFVSALIPAGSVVEKAFLYSSTYGRGVVTPTITFDGTLLTSGAWTAGGLAAGDQGLQAFRADVTSLVASKVGAGGLFNFSISEGPETFASNAFFTDGEVLAVVYSNPLEQNRTIAFLDGFSATAGDTTSLNLSAPLTASQLADPNFQAIMSLGIGYSYQEGSAQYSTVDVNGIRLTSSAGGSDDGSPSDGGLITAGGLGDSIANPADPFASPTEGGYIITGQYDDELYSLKPFLSPGLTTINIATKNPSNDDNIFFAGFNITAQASVNQPPVNSVPDGGATLSMVGLTLVAIGLLRRRRV